MERDQSQSAPNIGRPSTFTQDTADAICDRLAAGESLRSICRDDDMPATGTVCRWLADEAHRRFREQYARARESQADALFDEILDIADDGSNDWMERRDSEGENIGWKENGEALQRSRLRVDARKWMAGKLKPKVYGEKIDLNHSGHVATNPEDPDTARAIIARHEALMAEKKAASE